MRGASKLTFAGYADEWREAQPWAPRTRERVATSLERHLYPMIGDIPVTRLRPTQLQSVITRLADHQAPATVRLIAQHLSQVLNGAVADGIRVDNPARRLRLPRPDKGPLVVPSVEQVRRLAEEIERRSRGLVAVGAGLGLRQGEALALSKGSVDFLRRVVHVRAQLRSTNHGVVIDDTTKTGMARTVPLPASVADELAAHIDHYDTDHPDGLLFTSAQGSKIRYHNWNARAWKPAAAAVGLDAGYHCLRHFAATTLLRRGLSVAAVARVLGHSPGTTLKYYAHWVSDDSELVRGVLDDVLGAPKAHEAAGALGA